MVEEIADFLMCNNVSAVVIYEVISDLKVPGTYELVTSVLGQTLEIPVVFFQETIPSAGHLQGAK